MPKKKKEDFSYYVSRVLQNSMLTGIPQIVAAGNLPKRLVRTLVFFMCVAGFIYQSLAFMKMYWEYDVVMDVRIENPTHADRPSFTICNVFGFKTQEFCERKDEPEVARIIKENQLWCVSLHDEERNKYHLDWCTCVPRFCDEYGQVKNLSILYGFYDVPQIPRKTLNKWLLTPKEMLVRCQEQNMKPDSQKCDDYFVQIACEFLDVFPESCFTMNSKIGRPNHAEGKVFTESRFLLKVKHHTDNYPDSQRTTKVAISVHSPYAVVNPFYEGIMMKSNHNYRLHLKKVEKYLLPPPYKTNCMDYRSLWHARGGQGPTNFRECVLECQRNRSLEKHGCIVLDEILYPNNDDACDGDIWDANLTAEAIPCAEKNCRPACYEEYYTVTYHEWEEKSVDCQKTTLQLGNDYSLVYIQLEGMETTTYIYSPKYQDIETFSYLGGYVGMWLGISLVAVFDFVETVVIMMKYPLKRLALYRERRRKISQIRKFERNL